ncbi:MAG TPA: ATP-binding protein [Aquabacterium sp.]|nr:ATP-binding protein [Aquabacterium sp.]
MTSIARSPEGLPDAPRETRADALLDSRWVDQAMLQRSSAMARWVGWRLRMLVVLALLGSLGVFALLRTLAGLPHVDAHWRSIGANGVELTASGHAQLAAKVGRRLLAVEQADGHRIQIDASMLQRSPRWTVSDDERQRQLLLLEQLSRGLQQPVLKLHFDDGSVVQVAPAPRGFAGLGALFWFLGALALVLYLIAAVVALAAPNLANLLYALVALSQSLNLVLIAAESMPGPGIAPGFWRLSLDWRTACDLVSAAALVHVCLVHPLRLPRAPWLAAAAWSAALLFGALAAHQMLPAQWWLTQGLLIGFGLTAMVVLTWSYRREPHPFAIVLRRLGLGANAILILLTSAVALVGRGGPAQHMVANLGSMVWYVFFASLLLLVPFMSRSQHLVREFAMLAGISTVATSLDLLFVAVFSFGQLASLTLALFVTLGLYVAMRQWLVSQFAGSSMLSAERMFESLYRAAREIEAMPRRAEDQLARLLRELYEPLEMARAPRTVSRTRVAPDGSTMVVPVPRLPGLSEEDHAALNGAIVLRFARHGRHLFSSEDARLTDRVLEQLRRVVAYDRAVEHGRAEERARIAQDLHDDIGARLLTLMYKAQNAEMEEYIRHTLQDLKTLTRGLAASSHKLSHAAAEWKADITQRLNVTHCDLVWSFSADRDIPLTVVQWSGLTRVLRELVNNIIAHAQASKVEIAGVYDRGRLQLTVSDDGIGCQPEAWSHGLGLGGVRKRVKLLGGEVRWREGGSRGIVCEVRVPLLGSRI